MATQMMDYAEVLIKLNGPLAFLHNHIISLYNLCSVQVHCGADFTIYHLFDNLVAAGFAPKQLLKKPSPMNHLSPMELQVRIASKKVTLGVTDC